MPVKRKKQILFEARSGIRTTHYHHHHVHPSSPTLLSSDGADEKVRNVDDFVPDVGMHRSFLDEGAASKAKEKARRAGNMDSDSDGEGRGGNPMVSGFQDDFAPDELCQSVPKSVPKAAAVPSMGITLTSDEEDEGTNALNVVQDSGSDRRRYGWEENLNCMTSGFS
uniref:Uncharacterized protein n=1 Tax=Hucho hucho TaxID=62062 RepID=A0A4W5LSW3_9TELE